MSPPPAEPRIYHITHVDNLPAIVAAGGLVSDSAMIDRGGPAQAIGMSSIKRRRVVELEVDCHPGTKVGDYVPFYLCPRSVMLFVIHCANHLELHYRGGQDPIVHIEADLREAVAWAEGNESPWAFSLSNAGARYAVFRSGMERLQELDWDAIAATDFRASTVKERKQAEFLVHGRFPFDLVRRIGVRSAAMATRVTAALASASHRPRIDVRPEWYY